MSRRSNSASASAETLPECDPPRITFGAPIMIAMPRSRQASAASTVVGNSAKPTPSAPLRATCSSVVSSWLASTAPIRRASSTAPASCRVPYSACSPFRCATCASNSASDMLRFLATYCFIFDRSRNCRCPGVWSIRLTMPTRSSGPKPASSSSSVSEQISARRCRKWLIRIAPDARSAIISDANPRAYSA